MQTTGVKIREIEFGTGMPKICVPIVGKTKTEILEQAKDIVHKRPDCIELRIDWFEKAMDIPKVLEVLEALREVIGNIVLLFTFRTKQEGGEQTIAVKEYQMLCENVFRSGYIDLIDVETFMQEGLLSSICQIAHSNGVYVVASNHDFARTPEEEEIVKRLQYMDEQGADMLKIAVMPQQERDVLTLLSATLRYHENGGQKPIITMSMKDMGIISRLAGECFGSALTFATVGKTSAPGQIPIEQARQILSVLHRE